MIIHPARIAGVCLVEPTVVEDERGWFAELARLDRLAEHGFAGTFVRTAVSFNRRRGTLRGLHFQRPPCEDAKLVTCLSGRLFDVVADVRPDSSTFGQWEGFELTPENRRLVFVPEGVAHGFQTLADDTLMLYHIAALYEREAGAGIRWDDPTLAIEWPAPLAEMSDQDRRWSFLAS